MKILEIPKETRKHICKRYNNCSICPLKKTLWYKANLKKECYELEAEDVKLWFNTEIEKDCIIDYLGVIPIGIKEI